MLSFFSIGTANKLKGSVIFLNNTLSNAINTEQNMANPCIGLKLFQTELFYSYAIQDDGTNMKKNTSITNSKMIKYIIYVK